MNSEDDAWANQCPICKSGSLLPVVEKKLFGLITNKKFECVNCNTHLIQKGDGFQLSYVADASNNIWQKIKF
jgi:hypothetical protein